MIPRPTEMRRFCAEDDARIDPGPALSPRALPLAVVAGS